MLVLTTCPSYTKAGQMQGKNGQVVSSSECVSDDPIGQLTVTLGWGHGLVLVAAGQVKVSHNDLNSD